MGCYCCGLRDGGVLIVLAVKDGVEYVIQRGEKQRVMRIPIEGKESPFSLTFRKEQALLYWYFRILYGRLCVYIVISSSSGVPALPTEEEFHGYSFQNQMSTYGRHNTVVFLLRVRRRGSPVAITEEDVAFPKLRCRIDFVPTFMKCVTIPSSAGSEQNCVGI